MITLDESIMVADNMTRYGGSFVQVLASLILRADAVNLEKIKITWPEYWNKYKGMGKQE